MTIKKLNIDAPMWFRCSDLEKDRDQISVTVHYGRGNPISGPASFNQSLVVQRNDLRKLAQALLNQADELDKLKITDSDDSRWANVADPL